MKSLTMSAFFAGILGILVMTPAASTVDPPYDQGVGKQGDGTKTCDNKCRERYIFASKGLSGALTAIQYETPYCDWCTSCSGGADTACCMVNENDLFVSNSCRKLTPHARRMDCVAEELCAYGSTTGYFKQARWIAETPHAEMRDAGYSQTTCVPAQ